MPLPLGAALSVTAQTTNTPAYSALVMKILLPFKTHSLPSKTAEQRIPAGSEPAVVSVRPNPPA